MKILRIDKQVELIDIAEHDGEPSLDTLRSEVHGEIAYVDIGDGAVVLVNKSAEASGMQQNPIASLVARRQIHGPALIAGVIAGADGEEFTDAPEEYIALLGLTQ